jgi:hypothetical protein
MDDSASERRSLTFEELATLREKTDAIARFLQQQITGYLDTLRPLLAPGRFLGKYVGGREDVAGAERAVAEIRAQFREVCGKPFDLPPELDEDQLTFVENRPALYPWEYTYEARSPRETKRLTMTSSVRWVLTYKSSYTFSQLRQTVAGQYERRTDSLRQSVVNALVMRMTVERSPGMVRLLDDLRYEVRVDKSPGLGELPLVTVRSGLPSFRPADPLILTAIRSSGVPAFIELVDIDAVHGLEDPLKRRIGELLR